MSCSVFHLLGTNYQTYHVVSEKQKQNEHREKRVGVHVTTRITFVTGPIVGNPFYITTYYTRCI